MKSKQEREKGEKHQEKFKAGSKGSKEDVEKWEYLLLVCVSVGIKVLQDTLLHIAIHHGLGRAGRQKGLELGKLGGRGKAGLGEDNLELDEETTLLERVLVLGHTLV
jgi:hypothetical protein